MSTARDFLAAVQQRADAATDDVATEIGQALREWSDGCNRRQHSDGDAQMGIAYAAAERVLTRTDVPRLVAALTAALDLADDPQRHKVALGHVDRDDLLAVITDALTPKENDS